MNTPTELERVAQNKLHEMLMIEYGFVTENVEPMKALLTTYAKTVAEEAVREERKRLIDYVQHYPDCPISENTGSRLNADYKLEFMYNNKWHGLADLPPCNCGLTEALTPLPDKE